MCGGGRSETNTPSCWRSGSHGAVGGLSHLILICCFDELVLVERLVMGGWGGPMTQQQREREIQSLLISFMYFDMWLAANSILHVYTLAITWA